MAKYIKNSVRLQVKFVQKSSNKVILSLPSDTMEVHQFFQNEFVDQIIKQNFKNYEAIGNVLIVVDQEFQLK